MSEQYSHGTEKKASMPGKPISLEQIPILQNNDEEMNRISRLTIK